MFLRRIISLAFITITLMQYIDDKAVTHIDAKQVVTDGIPHSSSAFLTERLVIATIIIFGEVKLRSRWTILKLCSIEVLGLMANYILHYNYFTECRRRHHRVGAGGKLYVCLIL